jgi:hypothetical protein
MNPQKRLEKLAKWADNQDLATLENLIELDEKLDSTVQSLEKKIDEVKESIDESLKKKLDEELVYEIDEDKIVGSVLSKVVIPEPIKGDKGDKGDTITVEKVIEKVEVIRETPIVTENIVEKAMYENGEQIVVKINELSTDNEDVKIDAVHIKNLPQNEIEELYNRTQVLNQLIGGLRISINAVESSDVDSVSNSDGSLTISPTTGDVIASLNTAHGNIWTAQQEFDDHATWFRRDSDLSSDNSEFFVFGQGTRGTSNPDIKIFGWDVSAGAFYFADDDGNIEDIEAGVIAAFSGFNGNGANIFGLNADNISSGTLLQSRGGTNNTSYGANRVIYQNSGNTSFTSDADFRFIESANRLEIGTALSDLGQVLSLEKTRTDTITSNAYGSYTALTATPPANQATYAYIASIISNTKTGAFDLTSSWGLRGSQYNVLNTGTGALSTAAAYTGIVQNTGSGTIATGAVYEAFTPTAGVGAPITSAVAYRAEAQTTTGVTTGYGFQSLGASDRNFFAGTMSIGLTAVTDLYGLWLRPTISTSKGMVIQGITSQTGNLLELMNIAGTGMSAFDASGNLGIGTISPSSVSGQYIEVYNASSAGYSFRNSVRQWSFFVQATTGNYGLYNHSTSTYAFYVDGTNRFSNGVAAPVSTEQWNITSTTSTHKTLVLKAATSQSANIFEIQNSAGSVLGYFENTTNPNNGGILRVGRSSNYGNYQERAILGYYSPPDSASGWTTNQAVIEGVLDVTNASTTFSTYGGYAMYYRVTKSGAASVAGLGGAAGQVEVLSGSGNISLLHCLYSVYQNASTNTVTDVLGTQSYMGPSAANTATNTYGSQIWFAHTGSTNATNIYGYHLRNAMGTVGTMTNMYGFYMQDFTTKVTNTWGFYILGATTNNYLQGNIEIDGELNHDGTTVGFYGVTPVARSSTYTASNVTTDRSYDADATTVNELADVLGTLIADLKLTGIIG